MMVSFSLAMFFLFLFSPFFVLLFSILFLFLLAPVCHWFSSLATANCISERIYHTRRRVSLSFFFPFFFFFSFIDLVSLTRLTTDEGEGKGNDDNEQEKADTCHLMHQDGLQFSMFSSLSGVDINIDVCVGCRRPY